MKKVVVLAIITLAIIGLYISPVFASEEILNSVQTSELIQISEEQREELDDYVEDHGSETYGFTAFVLEPKTNSSL